MITVARERAVLHAVLQAGGGTADERIGRALELVAEELGMQVALLGRLRSGRFEVTHRHAAPGAAAAAVGADHPWSETVTSLLVDGAVGPVVADVAAHPLLARHPHVVELGIGACAGVPVLVDGQVWGALACAASGPTGSDPERDLATLLAVAQHLGAVVADPPDSGEDADELGTVAHVLTAGEGVEPLGRQLLALLQQATGLESTFLTSVDWAADEQRVLYSVNAGGMDVPEGLRVDWSDTLCRRSLDEGRTSIPDVPAVWGDSPTARAWGIGSYVSVPVLDGDQAVVGTLCGASRSRVDVDDRDLATMRMFSVLISQQLAAQASADLHRRRAAEMEARLEELDDLTLRDGLTGLSNRAGIHRWFETVLPGLHPGRDRLAVAFCDLDGFKQVNDTLGHAVGDEVLVRFGRALTGAVHPGDLCGRLGGDEFVVAAVLPTTGATLAGWSARLRAAARCQVPGPTGSCGDEVAASVGVVSFDRRTTAAEALAAADRAMYEAKAARRG